MLVVVPAFNEAGAIGKVIEGIRATDPRLPILVVDDGSADDTAAVARHASMANQPRHNALGPGRSRGGDWGVPGGPAAANDLWVALAMTERQYEAISKPSAAVRFAPDNREYASNLAEAKAGAAAPPAVRQAPATGAPPR